MIWLLLVLTASAEDSDDPLVEVDVNGHLKAFAVATFPYDHPLMPPDPVGQAFIDGRINLGVDIGDHVQVEVAHAITATLGGAPSVQIASTGVAPRAAQLVDLGWEAFDGESSTFTLLGRTDRLLVKASTPGLDVTVGRQPVSFGSGLFFTPLDLVNPFTPATIDSEYKPGVDAVRVDAYKGAGASATAVVTWADQPLGSDDPEQGLRRINAALTGQATVGVTDIGLFAGAIQGDGVFGATVISSVGPVGLHGDVALTLPRDGDVEDPFVRAVIGVDGLPHWRLSIAGELYVQTNGSTDPADLLTTLQGERYTRGELWLGGVAYAGVSANLEVTPLVHVGAATFVNLTDPSLLIAPSVNWSVAGNAVVAAGGYIGVGERPGALSEPGLGVKSEFGLYPGVGFVQVRTYF
jgi:hypothetical protein